MSDVLWYLNALPQALLVVDDSLKITYANQSAENLFAQSVAQLKGRALLGWLVFSEYFTELCVRALASGESISLFEEWLYFLHAQVPVTIHLAPISRVELLITFEKNDGLQKLAARSAKNEVNRASGIMAAMLAHEVKNPLSGIRGAAQLLKDEVAIEQQPLAELICSEVDRIRDLLNQVEIFTAGGPECVAVNIHEVLQYVISIAKTGFGQHVTFRERYDPSLPPVLAHRDLLVQMLLNLVKNASEALVDVPNPTVTVSTYYQSGYRMRAAGVAEVVSLPVAVDIEDNGTGIAENLRDQLFEPFLSSKDEGRGLGLAVVAKIAADMGASIELATKSTDVLSAGAKFTVRLAKA